MTFFRKVCHIHKIGIVLLGKEKNSLNPQNWSRKVDVTSLVNVLRIIVISPLTDPWILLLMKLMTFNKRWNHQRQQQQQQQQRRGEKAKKQNLMMMLLLLLLLLLSSCNDNEEESQKNLFFIDFDKMLRVIYWWTKVWQIWAMLLFVVKK